ncbi:unnamed protein product [Bursaphelenchus xylophilus]|uniref:(pine wood nematode) hypothetical protein n=1 Tax=Bursaphelenchus xylophilus TaxID=6326 RepID=A0A1I7RMU9_BURXY|nr:unnamed protein product [Bursaphelenchus xylophilus]CAG9125446.1 unnamed protein product [Bursaphelenchus xylophilus]
MSKPEEVENEEGWELVSHETVRATAFSAAFAMACTAAYYGLHVALFWAGGPIWLHGALWWSLWGRPIRGMRSLFYSLRWHLARLVWRKAAQREIRQ